MAADVWPPRASWRRRSICGTIDRRERADVSSLSSGFTSDWRAAEQTWQYRRQAARTGAFILKFSLRIQFKSVKKADSEDLFCASLLSSQDFLMFLRMTAVQALVLLIFGVVQVNGARVVSGELRSQHLIFFLCFMLTEYWGLNSLKTASEAPQEQREFHEWKDLKQRLINGVLACESWGMFSTASLIM